MSKYVIHVVAKHKGEEVARFKIAEVTTEAETVEILKTTKQEMADFVGNKKTDIESWLWIFIEANRFSGRSVQFEVELS